MDPVPPPETLFHGMVGRSAAMQTLFEKIVRYGPTDAPVLVTGETGSGKELVARALHRHSLRRAKPWVALNCSALNEDLFESELFGHDRGAFTGAISTHKGRFERANLGTLFLDEIGDMPKRVQAKLLRVLEHGTLERVGGEREISVDVRIVAATNVGLERAVRDGRFRDDLYHRIAVLRVHVPPLRDRRDDLPLLVTHFLSIFGSRYGERDARLSSEALHALEHYSWPGNIRELRNVLERLYVEAQAEVIGRNALLEWEREREMLVAGGWNLELRDQQRFGGALTGTEGDPVGDEELRQATRVLLRALQERNDRPRLTGPVLAGDEDGVPVMRVAAEVRPTLEQRPAELTEQTIREAYVAARGNLTAAARSLGVHKATLYRHMERLGIAREDLDVSG